jgi:hypothetical protein
MTHLKKIALIVLICIGFPFLSKAQLTNLVFFAEQGERFSVVLNGILQNDKPETNVKVTGLPAPSYKVKIIFENTKIPEIDKNLMFEQGTEITYNIRKNNKGEYVIRFLNQVPIEEVLPPAPDQRVVVYTTVPPATTVINQTTINNTTNVIDNSTNVNNNNISSEGNVSINMNLNQGGVAANVNTSSATVTSSTSTTSSGQPPHHDKPDHYVMPGYNGPIGCPYPMSDLDFADAKQSISSKSFEDSKLTIAKQITSANCLFASEVKEIMMLFDFESTRLSYAKFAYKYTFDRGNYYKVNDAFDFESSINDLNQHIQKSH